MDVTGGCNSDGTCSRGFYADEIRQRPDPETSRDLSRDQRDKLEIEGVLLDNDDIKNVAEDAEDLFEDFEDFMDPENPL